MSLVQIPLKKNPPKCNLRFGPVWAVPFELNYLMPLLNLPRKMVRLASLDLYEPGIQFRPQRWRRLHGTARQNDASFQSLNEQLIKAK